MPKPLREFRVMVQASLHPCFRLVALSNGNA